MAWSRSQTFTRSADFTGSSVTSTAVALGSAVAVDDWILLSTTCGSNVSAAASTVTDQLGNVYTRMSAVQGGRLYDNVNDQSYDGWYCKVTVAGTPTITYTPGGGTRAWLAFKGSVFSGGSSSASVRATNGQLQTSPGTATDAISSGSVAAQSGDLLWGGTFTSGTSSTTDVAGTGFTGSTRDATSGMIDEWKTATGAQAATFTDATAGAQPFETVGIAIAPGAVADPHANERRVFVPQLLDGWGE